MMREEYIPSMKDPQPYNVIENDVNRSSDIAQIILEYEEKVVPKMLELGFMKQIAKSRVKYNNDSDQSMMSHILPGVEVMADIVEQTDNIDKSEFRKLLALWTIHDLHKLIDNSKEDEFNIDRKVVESWVKNLNLDSFVDNELDIDDFHSCAVGLHDSRNSNIDDSTTQFTYLRSHLKLVDAVMSIYTPEEYINQAQKSVGLVFNKPNERFLPASHTIDIGDSILRTLINKSITEELKSKGLKPINYQENGVYYVQSENTEYDDAHTFLNNVIDTFFKNLKNSYSIFRNQAFIGGDISSESSQQGDWYMPNVYDITNLSTLCLSNTEIIQRIVQASVEQQNRPWGLSTDSMNKISKINSAYSEIDIPQSSFIEGMAALVHTVYREIVPELIVKNSHEPFERTMESAIVHIFGVSEDIQELMADSLVENKLNKSVTSWEYKYLIAYDLHKRYTMKYSDTERQTKLIELISTRLSDFENWDQYGESKSTKIKRELYLLLASKISLNGKELTDYPSIDLFDYMGKTGETNPCHITGKPTEQSSSSPDLLSNRNIGVLDVPFVNENEDNELEVLHLDDAVPKKSLSVFAQISLTIRAQQFKNNYSEVKDENALYVSIHPSDSISVASYVRFNRIFEYVKQEMFTTENNDISLYNISKEYKSIIQDSFESNTTVNAFLNRENIFNIGTRMDESSSKLTLPDKSESTMIKGTVCATIASMLSGVRVCITKQPQLYMNHHKKNELVIYGPELKTFKNIVKNNTDITTLPQTLETIERIIKMTSYTSTDIIQLYSNICEMDTVTLTGSMVFNRISHELDSKEKLQKAAKDALFIDTISSQNIPKKQKYIQYSNKISKKLSKIIEEDDVNLIHSVINMTFESIDKEDNRDESVKNILNTLTKIKKLKLDRNNIIDNSPEYEFANELYNAHKSMNNQNEKQAVITGVMVRTIMYNNIGDYL